MHVSATWLGLQEEGIPRNCSIGMAGWVCLKPSLERENVRGGSRGDHNLWEAPGLAIAIRGEYERTTSPGGWEVFVLGPACCAETIGRVMDESDGESSDCISLTNDRARQISWATLPTAAAVAVHPPSGRTCLIQGAAGFRPIYYTSSKSVLHFSTSLPFLRSHCSGTGLNTDLIAQMLVFGHRAGGRTLWQGINVVTPGRLVEFQATQIPLHHQLWRYDVLFDISERRRLEAQSTKETLCEVESAMDEAVADLQSLGPLAIPCGGGVDSSLLGAYLKRRGKVVRFWTNNQVDASRKEEEWMAPLSAQLHIPWQPVDFSREKFFRTYFEYLIRYQQPARDPQSIASRLTRQEALNHGDRYFVSGELCDADFGGLSAFNYLSRRFRTLRQISLVGKRARFWLTRALMDEKSLLLDLMQMTRGEELGQIAYGDLYRSEFMVETESIGYPGQSSAQRMGDLVTWLDLRMVPGSHCAAFFEVDEWPGGSTYFPFGHPRMIHLGLHLPHYRKRHAGQNKWLWRTFAARYIGEEVAFREKCSFDSPVSAWLDKAANVLCNGFLEELFSARVGDLVRESKPSDALLWTLVNLELWGRVNCWKEDPSCLMGKVL